MTLSISMVVVHKMCMTSCWFNEGALEGKRQILPHAHMKIWLEAAVWPLSLENGDFTVPRHQTATERPLPFLTHVQAATLVWYWRHLHSHWVEATRARYSQCSTWPLLHLEPHCHFFRRPEALFWTIKLLAVDRLIVYWQCAFGCFPIKLRQFAGPGFPS